MEFGKVWASCDHAACCGKDCGGDGKGVKLQASEFRELVERVWCVVVVKIQ
jgi:hypothetical protein